MNPLDRFYWVVVIILAAAMAMSSCASPGSVSMSRDNTSSEQTKADWDGCVDELKSNGTFDSAGASLASATMMLIEYGLGAPSVKACMRRKGYTQD